MNLRATLKSSTIDVSEKPYPGKVEKKLKDKEFSCLTVTICKKQADANSKSAKLCKTWAIMDEIKALFTGNISHKIILLPLVLAKGSRYSQASTILNNLTQFRVQRWWLRSLTYNQKQNPNKIRWTSLIANTLKVNMTISAIWISIGEDEIKIKGDLLLRKVKSFATKRLLRSPSSYSNLKVKMWSLNETMLCTMWQTDKWSSYWIKRASSLPLTWARTCLTTPSLSTSKSMHSRWDNFLNLWMICKRKTFTARRVISRSCIDKPASQLCSKARHLNPSQTTNNSISPSWTQRSPWIRTLKKWNRKKGVS